MNKDVLKNIHLHDEFIDSFKLIELGFGEFQNLDLGNDFYHLPFQLLSSGFERLMKCHICFGYHEKNGEFPDFHYLKNCGGNNGHDLGELKRNILQSYFSTNDIPALKEDYHFLSSDTDLDHLIYLLSEFGKLARYHNLDVVTNAAKPSINVKSLWEDFETKMLTSDTDLLKKIESSNLGEEALNTVQRWIVIILEKFVRSISRQFTLGKLGAIALQYSSTYYPFIMLTDEDLGTRNYRQETTRYKQKKRKVHRRTVIDKFKRKFKQSYVYKHIAKTDFAGDWPFYHDNITIECRENHWCVVTIDNKDYALNGAAQARYKIESVHDAGMAILGKSVGSFIQMALDLENEKHNKSLENRRA